MPRFSIIIPTKNAAATLPNALESVAKQNFDNWEIIVQDGGSKDATLEICNHYSNRVSLFLESCEDTGVYDAMNKAIKRANGDWIYFLGADDTLVDTGVLADVDRSIIKLPGIDLIYGKVLFKNSSSYYGGEFTLDRLLFERNLCHQSAFYRKDLFTRIGLFNLRYPIWADWDFNIRCYRHPEFAATYVDRTIAIYNEHHGLSKEWDPVFSKELPAAINFMHQAKLEEILTSRTWRWGTKLFGWFEKGK